MASLIRKIEHGYIGFETDFPPGGWSLDQTPTANSLGVSGWETSHGAVNKKSNLIRDCFFL